MLYSIVDVACKKTGVLDKTLHACMYTSTVQSSLLMLSIQRATLLPMLLGLEM